MSKLMMFSLIIFTSGVCHTSASASASASASVHAADVAGTPHPVDGAYLVSWSSRLPTTLVDDVQEILKTLPLAENDLQMSPGVLFVSGQSYSNKNDHIINRVHYFKDRGSRKNFDVWIMKQGAEHHSANKTEWSLLAIFVDKSVTPKKSYYLQMKGDNLPHRVPTLAAFSASCFVCHSGGPRAIRPQNSGGLVPDLDKHLWAQINSFNKTIGDYGVVETYVPAFDEKVKPLRLPGLMDNAPLAMSRCTVCHNSSDGSRAPLFRQNGDSVLALVEHGADSKGYYSGEFKEVYMPRHHAPLSVSEKRCLRAWLDNANEQPMPADCTEDGEVR